ncbi:TolC family protein [Flavihumibacter sp.]|uniref:TolC family protein n=1 Tax=Flavihumibacter sp. TaxID=1913981 RepID=UPI002FC6C941|nr:TolC family protein [Flavihumibacter sediminis]
MSLLRKRCSLLFTIGFLLVTSLPTAFSQQQPEVWDLRRCVDYAVANNISVRQSDVQKRLAVLQYEQNKYSKYPNANFSTNTGLQFGRSIDPTTNQFTNQRLLFQGFQFSTDVTIYNWGRISNNITAARLEAEAAGSDVDKVRNDIALNVATAYLQALLSKVQIDISAVQVEQSKGQLTDTRKRVDAGTLPELNAVDLEAQLARDSATLIGAEATYEQNLLNLKALLNLDAALPFTIAVPPVDQIPVEPMAELMPEVVYALALQNQPAQKANETRKQSLEYAVKASKAALYPTIFGSGGLASNFASTNRKITGFNFLGYSDPNPAAGAVTVDGQLIFLQSPNVQITQANKGFGELWNGWGTQMNNNFRQNVVVGMSIPIFNGYQARTAYERSKLSVKNQELIIEQGNQTLKQDIYSAYTNAVSSMQRFNASQSSLNATQKAYDFARRRYDLGLLSTLELITSQNNLTRAKIDMANAQFDYVFRMKVLEFYRGQGIKL